MPFLLLSFAALGAFDEKKSRIRRFGEGVLVVVTAPIWLPIVGIVHLTNYLTEPV